MGSWVRTAPILGVIAFALIVAAVIIGGEPPTTDDGAEEVVDYYTDKETEVGIASALLALGGAAFVLFYTNVAGRLRRAETRVSSLSIGVIAGAVMMGIGIEIFAGLGLTLSETIDDLEPGSVQTLHALSEFLFFPLAGGTVVLAWCLALAVLRNGGLPRWMGWVAVVIAVASITPAGFFAFLALGLLTLVMSIVMLMQPETA